ncbi:MAG: NAD(P)/FAD-dependent oxidoreductase [Bacteroidetes bacterium]|nr:MAG: NAD(P)/FAD-dependent oxidoreductase [Bacteroidota bacterium]
MKKILSYKQRPQITSSYDAIVIGSGIGGMSLAACLSKAGKRVLVLERHYTPGGFTHVFKRKHYEWDVGVHYVGDVHREGKLLNRMFHYITDGRLEWAEMGEVYDRMVFGEEVYDFVKGREAFAEQMKSYFPEEAHAIDAYMQAIYQVQRATKPYFLEKAMSPGLGWVMSPLLRNKMMKYAARTTLSVLQELGCSPRLIAVLTGQFGDYGLPPGQSSFAMHAMLAKHYMNGGAYPVGGSSSIFDSILPSIQQAGGQVYTRAEVSQILIEKGRAVGVRMQDGQEIYAPKIISNAGAFNTYLNLLPEACKQKLNVDQHLTSYEPSASHACLYIGCRQPASALQLPKANYWVYPDNYDHDLNVARYLQKPEGELPLAYISFPSAKDPDWENRYPNTSTIQVITLAPYHWFAPWEHQKWKKRGSEYEALKEGLSEKMLQILFRLHPNLNGHIDYHELSSPLSTRHFSNYPQGEIYGVSHTPQRFKNRFLRVKTPIPNLYLTGQDVVTAGIGGALFGGMLTASTLLKKNMLKVVYES